jgi:putative addiction module CopG family antidote
MTVALARDVEDFLEDQVRSGVCTDASEFVNDVIRALREQQQRLFDVTPELETWLLEAAERPVTPLTKSDFTAIRDRVRARLKSSAE